MARYEITMCPDYVKSWGFVEAVRELFQNALDQAELDESNEMSMDYDSNNQVLRIQNLNSVLDKSSMLLGATTKADNSNLIGQFGEGYKLAALVLSRLNYEMVIYNNAVNEVWTAKIVNSRRYQSKILCFDVDKSLLSWRKGEPSLIIEVRGITQSDYDEIYSQNLNLRGYGEKFIECSTGMILMDKEFQGQVYVKGLYVGEFDNLEYGYNLPPTGIVLDRDRKTIKNFELLWSTSRAWFNAFTENKITADELADVVLDSTEDVYYLNSQLNYETSTIKSFLQSLGTKFTMMFGANAIPVQSNDELEKANSRNRNPVFMSSSGYSLLSRSNLIDMKLDEDAETLETIIDDLVVWKEDNCDGILDQEVLSAFDSIISKLRKFE